MQQLTNVTLENEQLLLLSFQQDWDQDNIKQLAETVFFQLPLAKVLEHVQGADREYYRFLYKQDYLILHFETYSNACWVEGEDQLKVNSIIEISIALKSSFEKYSQ